MIFSNERQQLRQLFFTTWQKVEAKQPLEAIEQQIANVIAEHPEYQQTIANPDKYQDKDYTPEMGEVNPFLHMSLHLGIREQVATDRPQGITQVYQQLLQRLGDPHNVEHAMIDVLAEAMWQMQRTGEALSDQVYFKNLQNLLKV